MSVGCEYDDFIVLFYLQELRAQCQKFATALLDHTRSSSELEILLNHDSTGPVYQHGERMHLNRLKLAIKYRQKKVAITLIDSSNDKNILQTGVYLNVMSFL